MSDELKPCPFCGGTKIRFYKGSAPGHSSGMMFKCETCGARSGYYLKKENLIEKWNDRAKLAAREE